MQPVFAVVISTLLVVSGAGVGVATPEHGQDGGTVQSSVQQVGANETVEQADQAYVTEDGDVVLVYNGSSTDASSGHLGVDLSAGLMHLLFNDTVEEATNTTGSASVVLTPDQLTGEGEVLTEKPPSVEDLSVTASSVTTREESRSSMSLDASLVEESPAVAAGSSMFDSVTTEGQVTVTGTQFRTDGSATVSADASSVMNNEEMAVAVSLTERDGSYNLDVSREGTVSEWEAERWSTKEAARQTLESRFLPVAQQLGGEATIEIESYSFDSDSRQLALEYSVSYTGVKEAAADQLAAMLAEGELSDLSESESETLAEQLTRVEMTEVTAAVEVTDEGASSEWSVQIDNYNQAILAAIEIGQSLDVDEQQSQMESLAQSKAQIEAQTEANLTRTLSWEGAVEPTQNGVDLSLTAQQEATNWEAYVEALGERENASLGGASEFEMAAQTRDDEIVANASFSVSQDGLINQTIDSLQQQADPTMETGAESAIESFRRAEFEKAKMDVDLSDEEVTVEAGASVENATELQSLFENLYGETGDIQTLYAEPDNGQSMTYVRINNAVSDEPAEADVRALGPVDDETAVFLPDEWDEQEQSFPTPDTEEARSYLGLDEDGESMGMMIPVVVGGAALALAGGTVVGLRRRE